MANQFITNQTPTTYAYCMYQLMNVMSNAGWSIMAWSDGTTVHNTGTVPGPYQAGPGSPDAVFPLTGAFPNTGAAGGGGLDNAQAWFVMRQPKGTGSLGSYGGKRMIAFQRGTAANDFQWKIKYSVVGGYQFASNATTMPSLFSNVTQDDSIVIGGGTDAAPTFITLFGAVAAQRGSTRFNCMANDGLNFEVAPFGVWATGMNAGAGFFPSMGFIFEPMSAGTIAPGDLEPFVIGCDTNPGSAVNGSFVLSTSFGASGFFTNGGALGSANAWLRYGLTSATFQRIQPLSYFYIDSSLNGQMTVPAQNNRGTPLATNPVNSDDELFPIPYGRAASLGGVSGYKGVGSMMKWNSAARVTGDTQAQATVRDRIIMGVTSMPWDGSVPTL